MTKDQNSVTLRLVMGNATESSVSELLARVTQQLREPMLAANAVVAEHSAKSASAESVLLATAARYCPPAENFAATPPTGFDFEAGALFEAIVESAFLVANADGLFDDVERRAFTQVVREASGHRVSVRQIEAIVLDLQTLLEEDGFDKRYRRLATTITKHAHRRESLLVAALLAEVSDGISERERQVLECLAQAFELPVSMVDEALGEVRRHLSG